MTEFAKINPIGWASGERLTATQMNAIDTRLAAMLNRETDRWMNSWTSYATSTYASQSARTASGAAIAASATANQLAVYNDVLGASTRAITTTGGNWTGLWVAADQKNIVAIGLNDVTANKAVHSCTTGYLEDLAETTLPSAIAGDLVAGTTVTASPSTGYFYVHARATGAFWSSPTGATWTKQTTRTVVASSFQAYDLYANRGYVVLLDKSGNQNFIYYSQDHGVTWSSAVNIGDTTDGGLSSSRGNISTVQYSSALGLWVAVLRGGLTYTATTPAGPWTKINATAAADSIKWINVIDDGLICGILERNTGGANEPGVMIVWSFDLGLTWKSAAVQKGEDTGLWAMHFDGARLLLREYVGGALYRTDIRSVASYATI